ncbi:MAG: helix-turn-helix domain-containing protein [Planctomyces sp.]
MSETLYSPRQVARAIGASESSLKRWCDQGALTVIRTEGGHRRIAASEIVRFLRHNRHTLVEPNLLGFESAGTHAREKLLTSSGEELASVLTELLIREDEPAVRTFVMELYIAGRSLSWIFDEVITTSFREIGQRWECHQLEIYQERCSCQIVIRLLHELRRLQPDPVPSRRAVGGTLEGDHYDLPVAMCDVILRSAKWDTLLLGNSIPAASMISAIRTHRPGIFWLSVSHISDPQLFIRQIDELLDAAGECGTSMLLGGRCLTSEHRRRFRRATICDSLQQLEATAIQTASIVAKSSRAGKMKKPR